MANDAGVFAVQCPNPKCRKFQLVEERDRGNEVNCLVCKKPIQLPPMQDARAKKEPRTK